MSVTIHIGDALGILRGLPAQSVHCVVSSPPYWGLRDYGATGQIGLEPSLDRHMDVLLAVFDEVWRVLRDDGTLWLNYGDGYACPPNGRAAADIAGDDRGFVDKPFGTVGSGPLDLRAGSSVLDASFREILLASKAKDRLLMPEVLILALRARGWFVRQINIWNKTNPMPSSAKDRPGDCWEPIVLLSKSKRYFYDCDAVREGAVIKGRQPGVAGWADQGEVHSPLAHNVPKKNSFARKASKRAKAHPNPSVGTHREDRSSGIVMDGKRGLRSVWSFAVQPFKEGHFATFPEALVVPCIRAGTSEHGVCEACGAPWVRVVKRELVETPGADKGPHRPDKASEARGLSQGVNRACDGHVRGLVTVVRDVGWRPSCSCGSEKVVPAVVLDPFGGAGTTGLVADKLGRDALLIELNPDYAALAAERISKDGGLFSDVRVVEGKREAAE